MRFCIEPKFCNHKSFSLQIRSETSSSTDDESLILENTINQSLSNLITSTQIQDSSISEDFIEDSLPETVISYRFSSEEVIHVSKVQILNSYFFT